MADQLVVAALRVVFLFYIPLVLLHSSLERVYALRSRRQGRARPAAAAEPARWPAVDVVIPCFNEDPARLEACCRSVAGQDYPGRLEVWLVDDGSGNQGALLGVYERWADRGWSVRLLDRNTGKRAAQDEAVRRGRGELVGAVRRLPAQPPGRAVAALPDTDLRRRPLHQRRRPAPDQPGPGHRPPGAVRAPGHRQHLGAPVAAAVPAPAAALEPQLLPGAALDVRRDPLPAPLPGPGRAGQGPAAPAAGRRPGAAGLRGAAGRLGAAGRRPHPGPGHAAGDGGLPAGARGQRALPAAVRAAAHGPAGPGPGLGPAHPGRPVLGDALAQLRVRASSRRALRSPTSLPFSWYSEMARPSSCAASRPRPPSSSTSAWSRAASRSQIRVISSASSLRPRSNRTLASRVPTFTRGPVPPISSSCR